jgi:hypothetical protein
MLFPPGLQPDHLHFDPAGSGPGEQWLSQVPARWVVCLLADADQRPVQLLCSRNLRQALKRRLVDPQLASRRVDYRQFIRHLYWLPADSSFEADWVYLQLVRICFPSTYKALLNFREAWFIETEPQAPFPRWVKTNRPTTAAAGHCFIGPLPDKHAAARLIELLEEAFDLCRYYQILLQAPRGKACAYKEMGLCPAPCDGTISMAEYRTSIAASAAAAADPAGSIARLNAQMQELAAGLHFEAAARIRARLKPLEKLCKGPFRHLRALEECRWVVVGRGAGPQDAKFFLIDPAGVSVVTETDLATGVPAGAPKLPADLELMAEHLALACQHLFATKSDVVLLPAGTLALEQWQAARRSVLKRKTVNVEEGDVDREVGVTT